MKIHDLCNETAEDSCILIKILVLWLPDTPSPLPTPLTPLLAFVLNFLLLKHWQPLQNDLNPDWLTLNTDDPESSVSRDRQLSWMNSWVTLLRSRSENCGSLCVLSSSLARNQASFPRASLRHLKWQVDSWHTQVVFLFYNSLFPNYR